MKINDMYGKKIAIKFGESSETTDDILEDIDDLLQEYFDKEFRRIIRIRLIELINAARCECKEDLKQIIKNI